MPNFSNIAKSWSRPRISIAFGTAITSLINGAAKLKTKIIRIKATCAGTAHTLTILRPLGSKHTWTNAQEIAQRASGVAVNPLGSQGGEVANAWVMTAVAAGGTSYVLSRDPGNYSANFLNDKGAGSLGVTPLAANNLIASGDFLAIETAQPGVFFLATVSAASTNSVTGQCTVTATAAPTGGIPAGAQVFYFGVTTDIDPRTGEAHPSYLLTASVQNDLFAGELAIYETIEANEPMLAYDNNATATGSIDMIVGTFGP